MAMKRLRDFSEVKMLEDNGNKCGKCQNHDYEILKKGHARDCPFKKCECLKCRLLDARSDILQVISGKETKLKGTKKDPNCGFCQNHGVKILRKGHVRSCGYGQERHFRLDNCFDCEVHYIRNEVNRLQIKMRRAMKEDRTLSEEQRKTAREAITRDEVEKVCDMARMARRKRGVAIASQQVAGEASMMDVGFTQPPSLCGLSPPNYPSCSAAVMVKRERHSFDAQQDGTACRDFVNSSRPATVRRQPYHRQQQQQPQQQPQSKLKSFSHHQTAAGVWRPWSQQHQQQQQHHHHHHQLEMQQLHAQTQVVDCTMQQQGPFGTAEPNANGTTIDSLVNMFNRSDNNSTLTSLSMQSMPDLQQPIDPTDQASTNINLNAGTVNNITNHINSINSINSINNNNNNNNIQYGNINSLVSMAQDQPLSLVTRQSQEQQVLNTIQLFRLLLQFSMQNQNANQPNTPSY